MTIDHTMPDVRAAMEAVEAVEAWFDAWQTYDLVEGRSMREQAFKTVEAYKADLERAIQRAAIQYRREGIAKIKCSTMDTYTILSCPASYLTGASYYVQDAALP